MTHRPPPRSRQDHLGIHVPRLSQVCLLSGPMSWAVVTCSSRRAQTASAGPDGLITFPEALRLLGRSPASPLASSMNTFLRGGWGISSLDIFIGLLVGRATHCFSKYYFAGNSLPKLYCKITLDLSLYVSSLKVREVLDRIAFGKQC